MYHAVVFFIDRVMRNRNHRSLYDIFIVISGVPRAFWGSLFYLGLALLEHCKSKFNIPRIGPNKILIKITFYKPFCLQLK